MWFFYFIFFLPSCYFTPLVNGWKTYSSARTIIISFCWWLIAVHFPWMLITSKQSKTLHNNPALCRLVPLGTRCSYRDSIANAPSQQEIHLSLYLLFPNCKISPDALAGEGALFVFRNFLVWLGVFCLAIPWQVDAFSSADNEPLCYWGGIDSSQTHWGLSW